MNVCFISPSAELGGSEQSLLDILQVLRDAPVDASLLTFADGPLVGLARGCGVDARIVQLPKELFGLGEGALTSRLALGEIANAGRGWAGLVKFVSAFRGELAALGPDVVHTNGIKAHVFGGALAPRHMALVMHVRDYLSQRRIARRILPALRRQRMQVVANSRSVAADVRAVLPNIPVVSVHNAIDVSRFTPGPAEPGWLQSFAARPLPAPSVNVGLVGTYANWKGHDVLIRAVAEIGRLLPRVPVVLYIVGGPIYATRGSQFARAELEAEARRVGIHERVVFVPFQEEVSRVYRSLDIVVHASVRPEAFGRTIVEAMACGRAVVVARGGGASELFEEGVTALGHEPGNATALAKVLARLVQNPELRVRLGEAARYHAIREFDRSRLREQILSVYRHVLGDPSDAA